MIIYENNRIEGDTKIGDNVTIYPNSYISDSIIGKGTKIYSSFIEKSEIGCCSSVGPFAHTRTGTKLGDFVRLGNFCETKNVVIGKNTKISHLSYVGDAIVGENCNIGCGVVFVNYNGREKQQTIVKDHVFIGSNANIIAPITIDEDAYICAGSTVTSNVSKKDFLIARARETIKPNRSTKYW